MELAGPGGLVEAVREDLAQSLFVFLEKLPLATGLDMPANVLLGDDRGHHLFCITDSDVIGLNAAAFGLGIAAFCLGESLQLAEPGNSGG